MSVGAGLIDRPPFTAWFEQLCVLVGEKQLAETNDNLSPIPSQT
jgi:hypothetical protein